MRKLIELGHLYIATTPLFMVYENSKRKFIEDYAAWDNYLIDKMVKKFEIKNLKNTRDSYKKLIDECKSYIHFINIINKKFNIMPEILEFIISIYFTNDEINETIIKDLIVERFDELSLHLSDNTINGIVNDCYTSFTITEDLLNELYNIAEFVDSSSLYKNNIVDDTMSLNVKEKKQTTFQTISLFNIYDNLMKSVKPKEVYRFKGLGELNDNELWNSTMNPDTRKLLKVVLPENMEEVDTIFDNLMNDASKYADIRKLILLENQK